MEAALAEVFMASFTFAGPWILPDFIWNWMDR
jgi:hypothetical protein